MPSDEDLLQQASEWKTKGNDAFNAGRTVEAAAHYGRGIAACDRVVQSSDDVLAVKAALLGNRAACHLKVLDLPNAVADCTAALELNKGVDGRLRGKLLYRRAKARFLMHGSGINGNNELLQDAAKDLLLLLDEDPGNEEARRLL